MKQRFAPFLVLFEARYAPLLFAVAPQAWAVYLWLFPLPYTRTGELFAVLGAIGYEAIYVGAIAWAEEGKAGRWTWATAAVALIFSVAVAIYVYLPQGWWSLLHAGFPVVAFFYTMQLHRMMQVSTQQNAQQSGVNSARKGAELTPPSPAPKPHTRSRKKMTHVQIADALGKHPSTLSRQVRDGRATWRELEKSARNGRE